MLYLELMRFQMKPVILITLHRRYHELLNTLKNINLNTRFFKEKPSIFLIWADPEPGMYWFINQFLQNKTIEFLINRYVLPNENGKNPTTFYESQNIRLGLENVFRKYPNAYCIVQASDITIKEYGFYLIENEMNNGANAIVFDWQNKFNAKSFHTNCFSVINDKDLWPPYANIEDRDVLERLWFVQIEKNNLIKKFTVLSNNNEISFSHKHISELLKPLEKKSVFFNNSINCYIGGNLNLLKIILNFFRCIIFGDCNGKNCH